MITDNRSPGRPWLDTSPLRAREFDETMLERRGSSVVLEDRRMRVLVLFLLLSAAPAQQIAVLGKCLALDGDPWPHTEVTLCSHVVPWRPEVGTPHVVRVRADARGRFRATITAGRNYSMWASDGSAFSDVLTGVTGGNRSVLRQMRERRVSVRVRFPNREHWKKHEPLRFRIATFPKVSMFRGGTDARDVARMAKELPGKGIYVTVLAADGLPIRHVPIWTIASKQSGPATDGVHTHEVDLGTPGELEMFVNDVGGTPLRNARVLWRSAVKRPETYAPAHAVSHYLWHEVGQTKADGKTRIRFPRTKTKASGSPTEAILVRVEAPGFRPEFRRVTGDATVVLHRARSLRGQIWLEPDRPAAGLPLLFREVRRTRSEPGRQTSPGACSLVTRTDSLGRYEIPLAGRSDFRLLLVRPDTPTAGLAVVAVPARDGDLGDGPLVLNDARALRILVAKPDGMPAPGAQVLVQPIDTVGTEAARNLRAFADARGRVSVTVPRGEYDLLILHGTRWFALRRLASSRGRRRTEVQLEPTLVVRGIVRDLHGAPVPNVQLSVTGSRQPGGGPVEGLIANVNWALLHGSTTKDGRFDLSFIPRPGAEQSLSASWRGATRTIVQKDCLRLAGKAILNAEIQIPAE